MLVLSRVCHVKVAIRGSYYFACKSINMTLDVVYSALSWRLTHRGGL